MPLRAGGVRVALDDFETDPHRRASGKGKRRGRLLRTEVIRDNQKRRKKWKRFTGF